MDKRLYIYLLMVLVLPCVGALRAARISLLGNSRLYSKLYASPRKDYLITSQPNSNAVILLKSIKPDLKILHQTSQCNILSEGHLWTRYCDGIQLDAMLLENRYLGKHRASDEDTAKMWSVDIHKRSSFCPAGQFSAGLYSAELEVALAAVQKSAFVIRSLQRILLTPENHAINQILQNDHSNSESQSFSKADSTPVTVADFAIQALIIDAISKVFPGDLFIAEEDSALVRSDAAIREAVLEILFAATGTRWNAEKLCSTLDKGSFAGGTHSTASETKPTGPQRVWVLDPIDGTKGFMRNEHCCTGLGLLIDGVTQLSVLGCPNLNLLRLLQGSGYDNQSKCHIDQPLSLQDSLQPTSASSTNAPASSLPTVFHPDCGSVYYAVTDQGAFARSLSMPLGAAFEVSTSATTSSPSAVLCESAEAAYGDREVTQRTAEALGLTKDYVRIDGMCKHCVVGVGAAEATLRLPPAGYREKIWDHVAGDHFVREAGGKVTDLHGRPLDYRRVHSVIHNTRGKRSEEAKRVGENDVSYGGTVEVGRSSSRELSSDVQGVVISNGLLHEQIRRVVNTVRLSLSRK